MVNIKSPDMKLFTGAGAGSIATIPMTLFMLADWKQLPSDGRYALPPRRVTRIVIGPRRFWRMNPGTQTALTLMFHFSFGAVVGSIYGVVDEKIPLQSPVKRPLAGIVVWIGSCLGRIPALGILPPRQNIPGGET